MSLESRSRSTNPTALADRVLMHAIILSGFTAAYFVNRVFFLLTPITALAVFLAARRAEQAAWAAVEAEMMQSDLYAPELPNNTRQFVDAASLTLEKGEARRLLAAVVMQARPIFANRSTTFAANDEEGARRSAAELVEAACASALTLERLDWALRMDRASAAPADPAVQGTSGSPRTLFVSRLVDAAQALRLMLLAGFERSTPELDRVAELASELRAEARARSAAVEEVGKLLR